MVGPREESRLQLRLAFCSNQLEIIDPVGGRRHNDRLDGNFGVSRGNWKQETDMDATSLHQRLRNLVRQRLISLRQAGVSDLLRVPHESVPQIGPAAKRSSSGPGIAEPRAADREGSSVQPETIEAADRAPHSAPTFRAKEPTVPADGPEGQTPSRPQEVASLFEDFPMRAEPWPADERTGALSRLCEQVATCRLCDELASTRTQTVFGVGTPTARLVFLGEAPGADEDRQGEPFVGRAGKLLTKIIEACTLSREEVYILNILKCRPPGNRNPSTVESSNCRQFLAGQIDILRPEFICCLGAVAAQNLLQTNTPIGRLRGRFFKYREAQVMATYHPAYLLRNPSAKRDTWEDMKMLMRAMDIRAPSS